ncbi:MAG: biosynthetic-type acetolactate synthase large subunit [Intestinibacter bartlettii]|uniref:biosynthetic-type acetolactate synthase large subunit n=1 Tax=Intestinibacter bartlettii TaxID=261299 RepID=UPI0026ED69F0|nr:biosynthetic-type acetolactate synthase large subunit [Intestinibacter bartlettii]MDO5009438.1 biosynthetic-type acetolactate synthase large subunit [Intestinibacter bartlettii]
MEITGSQLIINSLIEEGVDKIFAYPGGYDKDIFDALYHEKDIELILPRHEQGLIHAAEGYARSTGKVGVCLVTSGPGATNLVTGIADANYDGIPLVCFTGQVATSVIGNDAFQEVDIVGITRTICKYSTTIRKREDLGRVIKEAFFIARTGKPGPVVVDLPSNIVGEFGPSEYPKTVDIRGYKPSTGVHIGQIKKALEMLKSAKKPLFLIGGGVNISHANEEFEKLVDITKVPVITTIMGKGAIPTSHPLFIGNVGMHGSYASNKAVNECDVLFSIGTRFNDRVTGKISEFAPNAKIIHIDIDSASISRNIVVNIPIVADAKDAIKELIPLVEELDTKQWIKQIKSWDKEHPVTAPSSVEGCISPQAIFENLNKVFTDGIFVTDVGQHQMWTTQFLEMNKNKQLITSGGLGTMGFGLPAAIGAQLGNPDKRVICIAGDGGVQMTIQELATAVQLELPITLVIINNGFLGMVRQMQQFFHDKNYSGTCLRKRKSCEGKCNFDGNNIPECCPPYTPDFIKLAESYGAYGIRVMDEDKLSDAFEEAKQNTDAPTIIEILIDFKDVVLPMVQGGKPLDNMLLETNY